jgi:hypothetical protein
LVAISALPPFHKETIFSEEILDNPLPKKRNEGPTPSQILSEYLVHSLQEENFWVSLELKFSHLFPTKVLTIFLVGMATRIKLWDS